MDETPASQPPFQRQRVGHVWVDSGRLIVSDPSYLDQLAEDQERLAEPMPERCEVISDGMAIAFQTGPRTGRYPVYVTRFENGCIAKIEIELDERASGISSS